MVNRNVTTERKLNEKIESICDVQDTAVNSLSNELFKLFLLDEIEQCKLLKLNPEFCLENVPSTGKGIFNMYQNCIEKNSKFLVYCGDNDAKNLYFTCEVNLMYRFVHDYYHAYFYNVGRGTTKLQDEKFLNCFLAYKVFLFTYNLLLNWGYSDNQAKRYAYKIFFELYADTVGQAEYYTKNGKFVSNQRLHTKKLLDSCAGFALSNNGDVLKCDIILHEYLNSCDVLLEDINNFNYNHKSCNYCSNYYEYWT